MSEEAKETSESKPIAKSQKPEKTGVAILTERKAGDQGILLRPVGSHQTDPFALQDISPTAGNQPSSPEASAPQATDSSSSSAAQGSITEGE